LTATRGHVVQTPDEKEPYKVVLEHEGGKDTEQPVPTVREGEELIKQETPTPPERDKTHDRPAPEAIGGDRAPHRRLRRQ
jgi:hypothetical protein